MSSISPPVIKTAAQFTYENQILFLGRLGYESDTGKAKIGDGLTRWASLGYFQFAAERLGLVLPVAINPERALKVVFPLAAGQNTVYTVPAGYTFVMIRGTFINTTAGAISVESKQVRGGIAHRLLNFISTSCTPNLGSNFFSSIAFLEAGDVIRLDAASVGVTAYIEGFLVANSPNFELKRLLFAPTTVKTALYTVPAGKIAIATLGTALAPGSEFAVNNDTGISPVSVNIFITTPEGGEQLCIAASNNTGGGNTTRHLNQFFRAGDVISAQSSVNNSGQSVVANLVVIDA